MDDEIQLISDGDGLAVIGDPTAVERFLAAEGLPSHDLDLPRLSSLLSHGSAATQAAGIATNSGRWVRLTKDSAQLMSKHGNHLMTNSKTGLSMGVVTGNGGQIQGIVQFAKGPGAMLANPALLAGAAGIMAQLAMQQAMNEITEYLAVIDAKIDDILQSQKDAVLADMIGVHLVIEEAMTIRKEVGRVSDITWSKVQGTSATIARTQAYALRQLDGLAEQLENKKVGDLATSSTDAAAKVNEWLAVLAQCFQLQDAIAVLELDRVLDSAPHELDRHRLGLKAARQKRLEAISRSSTHLLVRMAEAAGVANAKVLLHPSTARTVVDSGKHVSVAVGDFHERLGIEDSGASVERRRWIDAASDVKDRVVQTSVDGAGAARNLSAEAVDRAATATAKVSSGLAERAARWHRNTDES